MNTQISILGKKGKIIADATEVRIYLNEENRSFGLTKGWTIKDITGLTKNVNFYLRGEEYSSQIDYFIDCINNKHIDNKSSFESASQTDEVISLLLKISYQISKMNRVIFGDNQFFGVNHGSDEKSRAQLIKFKSNQAILDVLAAAVEEGIGSFMCTTHDRIGEICQNLRTEKRFEGSENLSLHALCA